MVLLKIFENQALSILIKDDNPSKLYKTVQQAGKGGFGRVFDSRHIAKKNMRVAIKKMPNVAEKDRKRNLKEIGALMFCKHPNIVELFSCFDTKDEIWMVMEFMEGGTLTEATKAHSWEEAEIAYVAREALQAISFLHENNLVHRDLKSNNIMMTIKGEIKLIDFGLCCDVRTCKKGKMAGSPYWMPPEMIQRKQHGFPIDIWSLSICILELANSLPPNRNSNIKAMFIVATEGCIKPLDKPHKWSEDFKDFLSHSLEYEPDRRSTAKELLKYKLLRKVASQDHMEKILSSIFLQHTLSSLGGFS